MKSFVMALLVVTAVGSTAAIGADAPLVMKEFHLNADQQKKFEEMTRLKTEYDKVAAPFEKEVDAWILEAASQLKKASNRNSGIDWRLERKQLLKRLEDIQARKDPRVDQLDQRMESIFRDVLKTLPNDKR